MTTHNWAEMLGAASGDVRRLSHVVRYSSIPVAIPENVAEHSYWVALYSVLIHQVLGTKERFQGWSEDQVIGQLLLKAIVHDMPECVTGDIVRTFKYSSKALKDEIDIAENKIIGEFPAALHSMISRTMDCGNEVYVNAVVKAADFLSLHQYMVREVRRGNREILRFFLKMEEDLKKMMVHYEMEEHKELAPLRGLYKEMIDTAKTARAGG